MYTYENTSTIQNETLNIFVSGKNLIVATHGFSDGMITDKNEQFEITPNDIRAIVASIHPKLANAKITLFVCFPQTVRATHYNELKENNIEILANWNNKTVASMTNGKLEFSAK